MELLIALSVTGIVAGATLTIALNSREMLEIDRQRTMINQNLRAGLDLLGIDVRQAGERLPGDAPAVEIVDGASGASDQLIVRRNMLDYVLPVCKNINAGSSADVVFVGKKKVTGPVPPGCAPVPDDNGDGWPDNLEAWRDYRINNGGVVTAYIHNPVTQQGEFFQYDDEDNSLFHIHRLNPGSWQFDYLMNQNPRVYILEQRSFRLDGDVLQVLINEDTANPLNLVNHIENFQVRAFLNDGTIASTLAGNNWVDLESIDVTLVGSSTIGTRPIDRTVNSNFFPRNILSN